MKDRLPGVSNLLLPVTALTPEVAEFKEIKAVFFPFLFNYTGVHYSSLSRKNDIVVSLRTFCWGKKTTKKNKIRVARLLSDRMNPLKRVISLLKSVLWSWHSLTCNRAERKAMQPGVCSLCCVFCCEGTVELCLYTWFPLSEGEMKGSPWGTHKDGKIWKCFGWA